MCITHIHNCTKWLRAGLRRIKPWQHFHFLEFSQHWCGLRWCLSNSHDRLSYPTLHSATTTWPVHSQTSLTTLVASCTGDWLENLHSSKHLKTRLGMCISRSKLHIEKIRKLVAWRAMCVHNEYIHPYRHCSTFILDSNSLTFWQVMKCRSTRAQYSLTTYSEAKTRTTTCLQQNSISCVQSKWRSLKY